MFLIFILGILVLIGGIIAGEVWTKLPDKQAYDKEYARVWDEVTTTFWHC